MSQEKRAGERIQILGELPGAASVTQPIVIRQLGPGGAEVETSFPLQVNSLHDFRLSLDSRTIVVRGRVAHCHIGDIDQTGVVYVAGIEFVETPARTAEVIDSFIEAMKAGRR